MKDQNYRSKSAKLLINDNHEKQHNRIDNDDPDCEKQHGKDNNHEKQHDHIDNDDPDREKQHEQFSYRKSTNYTSMFVKSSMK